MQIEMTFDRDFERFINHLEDKYGVAFTELNNLSNRYLGLSTFIDNFIDTKTVADASADGSSNVNHKDIVTLRSEMSKPHEKMLAYNKIFYEMKKKYGLNRAKQWLELQWSYGLYLHDANTSTFIPYCYKGEETLEVVYNDKHLLTSFSQLYDLLTEKEEFDPTINQVAKFPQSLYVKDIENGQIVLTPITRIVRHANTEALHFIKYANGLSQIVTANHPIITDAGDKPAALVTTNDKVFTYNSVEFDNQLHEQYVPGSAIFPNEKNTGTFPLNYDFGWLYGLILAEASIERWSVNFKQKNSLQQQRVFELLNKYNIPYSFDEDSELFRLLSHPFAQWVKNTNQYQHSEAKALAPDYIHYSHDFLDGVVAGLIDGDGTVTGAQKRVCQIRITSELLCRQISAYLQYHGIFVGDRIPYQSQSMSGFHSNLPVYGITFNLSNDYFRTIHCLKVDSVYQPRIRNGNFANKKYQYHYEWVSVLENVQLPYSCDEVYDITTGSGHFICNNVLSHNCFAYDLKAIAEKGLFYLNDHKLPEPPKHLDTFITFVKEFINFASNRSAGAVGLPNLIPYMFYFWKKDCENGVHGLTVTNPEQYAKSQIQNFIYAINQPYTRDGIQSAFTNTSIFDHEYFSALFGAAQFPDGSYMIDYEDEIIQFEKWFLEEMKAIKDGGRMFTFPVNTISLLRQDGKFVDEDFAHWASNHNRTWNDSNFFCDSSVNSLSNCCRLKSDITDLYFNSIGGSALKVGSVKVSTVNLARIAYETKTEQEYLDVLKERLIINMEALDCVRHIIKRNVEKGLLPNFMEGIMDFEHLYNTVGINGVYETMKTFGYTYKDEFGNTFYKQEAFNFGKKIFELCHDTIKEFTADKDYRGNIEQVPAETAAARFLAADRMLFPDQVVTDLPLYGNQWIPLGIPATLQERIRICAAFDGFCNGGSIMHVNVDAPFATEDQAWEMLNYITDQGVTYFAFNGKLSTDDHHHLFYGDTCPICGAPKTQEWTRTVGFFTPTSGWSKERKAEYELREWLPLNEKGIKA